MCVDSIIQTFEQQKYKKIKAIPYLEERLYMMESLIKTILYDQALKFLKLLSELLDLDVSYEVLQNEGT